MTKITDMIFLFLVFNFLVPVPCLKGESEESWSMASSALLDKLAQRANTHVTLISLIPASSF